MIRQVVYISKATSALTDAELQELVQTASRNNERRGITGALLFIEQSFIQIIEGEEAAIAELFTALAEDPRHRDIRVLSDRQVPGRDFSNWSMGLVRPPATEEPAVVGELRAAEAGGSRGEGGALVAPLCQTFTLMQRMYEVDAVLQRARG